MEAKAKCTEGQGEPNRKHSQDSARGQAEPRRTRNVISAQLLLWLAEFSYVCLLCVQLLLFGGTKCYNEKK